MSNIGSGGGTSYPSSLDTQTTPEVDSPNAGATKARAAVPNDLAAAVIAIETKLGVNPSGTITDVKTFLQTEHGTNGTHQVQQTMAAGSAAAPQIKSATDASGFYFPINQVGIAIAGLSVGLFTSTGLNGCAIGTTTAAAVSGTTGTFTGAVSGASYSGGAVSGTTGTFTGAVSGTTGTFTGVTNGSNAAAGVVGEYLVATASTVNIPSDGTYYTITSLSLTAGDWLLLGGANHIGSAVTSAIYVAISTTATGTGADNADVATGACNATANVGSATMHRRASIAATTTYYLTCRAISAAGTLFGTLRAIRIR